MIDADRQWLQANLRHQAHLVLLKELNMFLGNVRTLGTMATYLAGIGFGCLYMTPSYVIGTDDTIDGGFRREGSYQEIILATLSCIAISLSLFVIVVTQWCSVFGTDLAYRGGDAGSLSQALDGIYHERKICVRTFLSSVFFTLLSAAGLGL